MDELYHLVLTPDFCSLQFWSDEGHWYARLIWQSDGDITAFWGYGPCPDAETVIGQAVLAYYRALPAPNYQPVPRPLQRVWNALRAKVFDRDNFTCQYCGQRGGDLECDHIVPISRGGSNALTNLTTSCRSCNNKKRAMTPEEWLS